MKSIKLFSLFAVMVLLSISCSKKSEPLNTEEINLADDEVVAEAIFDDLFASSCSHILNTSNYMKTDNI